MSIKLTILGFNSAIPKKNSAPTAQLLEIANRYFLIDCGEGTQVQLRRAKIKFSKIKHIFISHLHGDHVFGLIGLISTLQLLGRETSLTVFGPVGIEDFIMNQIRHAQVRCGFDLNFVEVANKESKLVFEDDKIEVYNIPLDHRIPTNGWLFKEKPKLRNLNMKAIGRYPEIEICDYDNLKHGKDFQCEDGTVIPNKELTLNPDKPLSYAFCSDTRYKPDIVPLIKGVDLLYHESTFMSDLQEMAEYTGHSTAREAASIARDAGVGKLLLGHFSNRYKDLTPLHNEAKSVFENSVMPQVLGVYEVESKKAKEKA